MIKNLRKLAKIVTIDKIIPAINSDNLEIAVVGGWHIVTAKDTLHAGDKAVMFEIDCLVPVEDPRFGMADWAVEQAKVYSEGDVKRYRLRTAKLRGNISQGMLVPVASFGMEDREVGDDVTEELGIVKYEPEIPIGSNVIGEFPTTLAIKSDSERVQNLADIWDEIKSHKWVATEKIDGTSITLINDGGVARVSGRNYEVKAEGHPIWAVVDKEEFLASVPEGHSVQGEFFGQKIQNNPLGIDGRDFKVFAEFDNGRVVEAEDWSQWSKDRQVPIIDMELPETIEELVEEVSGMKSTVTKNRLAEGIVFHEVNGHVIPQLGRPSFKVISNKFLLKHGG